MRTFLKNQIKSEERDIKNIWRRIKTRDFSGNTGLAIKNSLYQISTNFFAKIGSLIFTILLARLLMPELFGLYSLALSTILIFVTISELGISTTLIKFVSREFGKKRKKLKPYILHFGKIKFTFILFSVFALIISAKDISNNFYQKPIFLALLAGTLYILFSQITGFLQSLLRASNNFKSVLKKEIVFQTSRIILVPLAVLLAIRYSLLGEINLMLIIIVLAFSYLLASLALFFDVKKIYLRKIKKEKSAKLSKKQKLITNKFILATAVLALSGVFFGNIDRIMLGVFVRGEFIGYYTAAFSFIGALTLLAGFFVPVSLPIFSRLKGKSLEQGFRKAIRITLLLTLGIALLTFSISKFLMLLTYGQDYLPSAEILKILSLLLIILPLTGIYSSYMISQGKPNVVAKLLIISTLMNIFLNYFLITFFLQYGEIFAVYGAAIATLISKFVYFGGLVFGRKKR